MLKRAGVIVAALLLASGGAFAQNAAKSPLERLYTETPKRGATSSPMASQRGTLPAERPEQVRRGGSPLERIYGPRSSGGRSTGGAAPNRASSLGTGSRATGLQRAPGAGQPSSSGTGTGPRRLGYGDVTNQVGPNYRSQQGLGPQRGPTVFRSGGRGVGGGRR